MRTVCRAPESFLSITVCYYFLRGKKSILLTMLTVCTEDIAVAVYLLDLFPLSLLISLSPIVFSGALYHLSEMPVREHLEREGLLKKTWKVTGGSFKAKK